MYILNRPGQKLVKLTDYIKESSLSFEAIGYYWSLGFYINSEI